MSTYKAVYLAKRPKSTIVPGETFSIKEHPIPKAVDLKDGEIIFQALYLSLDPAMRGWLNGKHTLQTLLSFTDISFFTDVRSYVPPVQIGEIMRGITIGVVKASKSKTFPVGSHAIGSVGWTEIAVVKDKQLERIDIPSNGKLTDFLGILGEESNCQSRTIKIDLRWFQDLLV